MIGKFLEAHPLDSIDLLLTLLTVVGIIAFQQVTLNHRLKTLLDILFVLDGERERKEGFLTFGVVGARLTNNLIGEDTTKVSLHEVGIR